MLCEWLSKPETFQSLYTIFVQGDAGTRRAILDHRDMEVLVKRADFPAKRLVAAWGKPPSGAKRPATLMPPERESSPSSLGPKPWKPKTPSRSRGPHCKPGERSGSGDHADDEAQHRD
jgi:hypothetical protein